MIACRFFSRTGSVWKLENVVYVLPKPINYFQGSIHSQSLSCSSRTGGSKHAVNAMDHKKKRRTVTPLWRPVSTQSNSYEGCSEKDAKTFQVIDCNDKSNVECEALEETPALSGDMVEKVSQSQCNVIELESSGTQYKEEVKESTLHELDITVCRVNDAEKYSTSVVVDASLIRFVKGKGGSTQKQIEGETGVKIIFPLSKGEDMIVIEGSSAENVTKASEKIKVVLEEGIKSPQLDYSHFISLPLAIHLELVEKLNEFQNSILGNLESSQDVNLDSDSSEASSDDGEDKNNQLDAGVKLAVNLEIQEDNEHVKVNIDDAVGKIDAIKTERSSILSNTPAKLGIDRSIFIKPRTFHFTVLMLKLWNRERLAAATEVLQRISPKVKDALDGRPVFVRLKGLECMKGSQAKARVLYAPVEEVGGEDRLLRACQVIIEAYVDAGLVLEKDANQKLKLHATLMNARHRKRKKRTRRYESFDARDIYNQYGSEEWGDYLIREAHLSQRFAFDDDGYYHCCTSIPFPENMQTE